MKILRASIYSFLGIGVCLVLSHGPTMAQAQTCWQVFYVSSGPPDSPDEVICLSSATEGYIRETTIFGDVQGCNRVTVNRNGGAMDFIVDYSKCNNNAPNHSISCPSPQGDRFKCTWRVLDNSQAPSDVLLLREK
jgi:hypothetical protein